MMARIRPVQNKRCKLADKMVRGLPDLNMGVVRDSNERTVGRKFDSLDGFFEVKMVEDDTPAEAEQEGPAIFKS